MIDALIQGKLHTKAKDGAQQFVNVIAFAPDACTALLALGAGDAVALLAGYRLPCGAGAAQRLRWMCTPKGGIKS